MTEGRWFKIAKVAVPGIQFSRQTLVSFIDMPSVSLSLQKWVTERQSALDELEAAHRSLGGAARGRRYATQQINQAYAVLLSSQFQGFCRDLHAECADHLSRSVPVLMQIPIRNVLTQNRMLDKGNANPGNIGSDYNRFGLAFWSEVRGLDLRNQGRQDRLQELSFWRNAIAHQDFNAAVLGTTALRLQQVRHWRTACNELARGFDAVLRIHIQSLTGTSPW